MDIDNIYNVNDLFSNFQLVIELIANDSYKRINTANDKEYVGYLSIKNLRKLL